MITPDDITDSMLSQFHATQIAVNSGEYAKAVIAASVNAYLASNPACAAGEELLEALEALYRVRYQACHLPEVVMANEQVKAVLAKVKGGEA